jgi:proteasome lid subunit RPN8/RPN11
VLADGTVRRCVNSHEAPRLAFRLSSADALFLERSYRTSNPAQVLYHSHVGGPAAFSRADRLCASLHPNLTFIVVHENEGRTHRGIPS